MPHRFLNQIQPIVQHGVRELQAGESVVHTLTEVALMGALVGTGVPAADAIRRVEQAEPTLLGQAESWETMYHPGTAAPGMYGQQPWRGAMGKGGMMPGMMGKGGMMPGTMGKGGMMPGTMGKGGMMPGTMGKGGMMPGTMGKGGMMPGTMGKGGMMPGAMGKGGMMPGTMGTWQGS